MQMSASLYFYTVNIHLHVILCNPFNHLITHMHYVLHRRNENMFQKIDHCSLS